MKTKQEQFKDRLHSMSDIDMIRMEGLRHHIYHAFPLQGGLIPKITLLEFATLVMEETALRRDIAQRGEMRRRK